jgi:hypothetical protein
MSEDEIKKIYAIFFEKAWASIGFPGMKINPNEPIPDYIKEMLREICLKTN